MTASVTSNSSLLWYKANGPWDYHGKPGILMGGQQVPKTTVTINVCMRISWQIIFLTNLNCEEFVNSIVMILYGQSIALTKFEGCSFATTRTSGVFNFPFIHLCIKCYAALRGFFSLLIKMLCSFLKWKEKCKHSYPNKNVQLPCCCTVWRSILYLCSSL